MTPRCTQKVQFGSEMLPQDGLKEPETAGRPPRGSLVPRVGSEESHLSHPGDPTGAKMGFKGGQNGSNWHQNVHQEAQQAKFKNVKKRLVFPSQRTGGAPQEEPKLNSQRSIVVKGGGSMFTKEYLAPHDQQEVIQGRPYEDPPPPRFVRFWTPYTFP